MIKNASIDKVMKSYRSKASFVHRQPKIVSLLMLIWYGIWSYFCFTYIMPTGIMLFDLLPLSLTWVGLANIWFWLVIGFGMLRLLANCIFSTVAALLRLAV